MEKLAKKGKKQIVIEPIQPMALPIKKKPAEEDIEEADDDANEVEIERKVPAPQKKPDKFAFLEDDDDSDWEEKKPVKEVVNKPVNKVLNKPVKEKKAGRKVEALKKGSVCMSIVHLLTCL